jgi:hypothetical protein
VYGVVPLKFFDHFIDQEAGTMAPEMLPVVTPG